MKTMQRVGSGMKSLAAVGLVAAGMLGWAPTASGETEIPKAGMIATASSGASPANAIDGVLPSGNGLNSWLSGTFPSWIRFDLGGRYAVSTFNYFAWTWGDARSINAYQLYITDSSSTDMNTWGQPVASGNFAKQIDSYQPVSISPAREGRYVILYGVSDHNNWQIGAGEVQIFGESAIGPAITACTLLDQVVQVSQFTVATTVDVSLTATAGNAQINAYAITTGSSQPSEGWVDVTATDALDVTTTYTFPEQAAGNVTLYLWVRDTAAQVAQTARTIYYQPTTPAVSAIVKTTHAGHQARVTWTTSVTVFSRVRYKASGASEWTATAWRSAAGTSHSHDLTGLELDTNYDLLLDSHRVESTETYAHLTGVAEVDKADMIATASSTNSVRYPSNAIDGVLPSGSGDNSWLSGVIPSWIRLDLGVPHAVHVVDYHGWTWSDIRCINAYALYVTDSASTDMADWGSAAASGNFVKAWGEQGVVPATPKTGRYVILYGTSDHNAWQIGAGELWVYGVPVTPPVIESFALKDQVVDATLFTVERTVAVSVSAAPAPGGEPIAGYAITEVNVQPDLGSEVWNASSPTSYTFAEQGAGNVTLYLWVKSEDGQVSTTQRTIHYQPATPTISSIVMTPVGAKTLTVTWTTDVSVFGRLRYRAEGESEWRETAWEASVRTSHSRTILDLDVDTRFEVQVQSHRVTEAREHDHYLGYIEVPKSDMTATASSWMGGGYQAVPSRAIDDSLSLYWLSGGGVPQWLRIQIEKPMDWGLLRYYGHHGGARGIKDYRIYVTEVVSDNVADWGDPVATGTFAPSVSGLFQDIAFPLTRGTVFILYAVSEYVDGSWATGAGEVWLYGKVPPPKGTIIMLR